MATFSIRGHDVRSTKGGMAEVQDVQPADLKFVSSLGGETVYFSYLDNAVKSAEVSLSDYNIILNEVHLNDGTLPDRIEVFEMEWLSNAGLEKSQIINLAFDGDDAARDCLFVIDGAPLPPRIDVATMTNLLNTADFRLSDDISEGQDFVIHLSEMPNVDISGVILRLFEDATAVDEAADQFHFFQSSNLEQATMEADSFIIEEQQADPHEINQPVAEPAAAENMPDTYVPDSNFEDFGA